MNVRILLRLLHTLEELRKHETWTLQQLAQYQAAALGQLRQYAYQKSPFYQSFHKGFMDRPLQELPILTKAMMMENFDQFVTDRSLHLEGIVPTPNKLRLGSAIRIATGSMQPLGARVIQDSFCSMTQSGFPFWHPLHVRRNGRA